MFQVTFQILEKVRNNKRPEIPDQCSGGLAKLTKRCWEQNPGKRPSFKVGFQDTYRQQLESLCAEPVSRGN